MSELAVAFQPATNGGVFSVSATLSPNHSVSHGQGPLGPSRGDFPGDSRRWTSRDVERAIRERLGWG